VIVRDDGDHLILIRQPDHADLSGQLAAVWGKPPWEVPEPHQSVVVAARLHDQAWHFWDEAPGQREDGRPRSFFEVDRVVTTGLYTHGADAVAAIDAYAGLLVSLHYSGFFHGHWEWTPFATPERFPEPEATALRLFVQDELGRQKSLRARLDLNNASAEARLRAHYEWLQIWDRISLDVCRHDPGAGFEDAYPPVPLTSGTGAESVPLRISIPGPGRCLLAPYPLRRAPFRTAIRAVRLPVTSCGEREAFLQAWRLAEPEAIAVTFEPG